LEYDHDSEDRRAVLCVLAKNCQDDGYKKLVTALCKTWKIRMLQVDSREDLGKMAGLYKSDASGVARKVRPCSCVVVRSWPKNEELKTHVSVLESQAQL
jgi:small subunit ribosomal protein S12e